MAYNNSLTAAQKMKIFAPFFESTRAPGQSKNVDYDCLFCNKPVPSGASAGRSFTGTAIVWSHAACLHNVGGSLSTDKAAKQKASKNFWDRFNVEKKAAREANAPAHVCPTVESVDKDAIEAAIAAEYDDVLAQLTTRVNEQTARIAELTRELAAYKAATITGNEPMVPDQQTLNARQNDSALTPQELAQNLETADDPNRCGQPKKDGMRCRWNISKSACRHHNAAAVVAAMSDPKNETTVDVVQEEDAPEQPRKVRPENGEFDVQFVELLNNGAVRLYHETQMYNLDYNGHYCAYLLDSPSLVTAFKTIPRGSTVRVHLANARIVSVKVLIGNSSEAARKAKRNAGQAA